MKKSYRITFSILLAVGIIFLAIGLIAPFIVERLYSIGYSVGYIAGGIDFPNYTDMMFNHLYGLWAIFVHLGGAIILSSGFALIFHKMVATAWQDRYLCPLACIERFRSLRIGILSPHAFHFR